MSALAQLTDDAGPTVERLTAQFDERGPDGTALATLDELAALLVTRREQEPDAARDVVAESLLLEAAALLLVAAHRAGDDRRDLALERLDEAVSTVERAWPALRMSVIPRAMALGAPLLRAADHSGLAASAQQRLERWAQLLAAARQRQLELRAEATSELAIADHLAARLDALAEQHRGPIRETAQAHAESARLAAVFAGDRNLSERARALAGRLA